MPKLRHPDWNLVIAALPPGFVGLLKDMSKLMGLPGWGWLEVPSLRVMVLDVATVSLARTLMEDGGMTSEADAYDHAHELLGIEDDPDKGQSPGTAFLWRLRSWRRAVKQHSPPPDWLLDYFPATTDEGDE